MKEDIVIKRVWAMPNKWTFTIKPIRELLEEEVSFGKWIDPYNISRERKTRS